MSTTHPPAAPRYGLGPEVLLVCQDGEARLLDMGRGKFYGMGPLSTRVLTLALDRGPDEAASQVAREHEVPEEQVRRDLGAFLQGLRRKGLIARRPARWVRPPGRVRCLLLLTWAWLSLRLFGWAGSVRLWKRWHAGMRPGWGPEETAAAVRAVDGAVRASAARHPLNPQCKERALVGWHLLRGAHGLPAHLVVGLELYPFSLHVWVECGPWVVTDDPARCATYSPVARYR